MILVIRIKKNAQMEDQKILTFLNYQKKERVFKNQPRLFSKSGS
jgi:hypothetical protein